MIGISKTEQSDTFTRFQPMAVQGLSVRKKALYVLQDLRRPEKALQLLCLRFSFETLHIQIENDFMPHNIIATRPR